MTQPVILALDSSTTATKAIAFDLDGHAVAEARREYLRYNPKPGWQEQDARDWWRATAEAIAEVTAQVGGRDVLALAMTHQRETFVLLDDHDEPIRPAVLWLDTRAGQQIARVGNEEVHRLSGKPPSTTPSFYKLIWLAENEPEAIRRTRRVVEVHAYLTYQLTGQWATSWATTDPMAVLDMSTFSYSDELLQLCGLTVEQMVPLHAPGAVMATVSDPVADQLGLPRDLPVVAGAGDGQSSGLGANVTSATCAYLSLGTSMTLGVHSEQYLHSRAFRTLASPIAGAYTLEALLSSGGLCIAWFRDQLSGMSRDDGPIEPRLNELAAQVPPGARGVQFLPYLTSAETPHWDANARGAFLGVADTHGVGELYRAVLEGLALEERMMLTRMEEATGARVERIVAMGGGVKSAVFNQILADALQRPVDVCAEPETTCLGAAILGAAAVGAGGVHDVREAAGRMSRLSHTVVPQAATRPVYDLAAKVHDAIYPAIQGLFTDIAQLRERGQ